MACARRSGGYTRSGYIVAKWKKESPFPQSNQTSIFLSHSPPGAPLKYAYVWCIYINVSARRGKIWTCRYKFHSMCCCSLFLCAKIAAPEQIHTKHTLTHNWVPRCVSVSVYVCFRIVFFSLAPTLKKAENNNTNKTKKSGRNRADSDVNCLYAFVQHQIPIGKTIRRYEIVENPDKITFVVARLIPLHAYEIVLSYASARSGERRGSDSSRKIAAFCSGNSFSHADAQFIARPAYTHCVRYNMHALNSTTTDKIYRYHYFFSYYSEKKTNNFVYIFIPNFCLFALSFAIFLSFFTRFLPTHIWFRSLRLARFAAFFTSVHTIFNGYRGHRNIIYLNI